MNPTAYYCWCCGELTMAYQTRPTCLGADKRICVFCDGKTKRKRVRPSYWPPEAKNLRMYNKFKEGKAYPEITFTITLSDGTVESR